MNERGALVMLLVARYSEVTDGGHRVNDWSIRFLNTS